MIVVGLAPRQDTEHRSRVGSSTPHRGLHLLQGRGPLGPSGATTVVSATSSTDVAERLGARAPRSGALVLKLRSLVVDGQPAGSKLAPRPLITPSDHGGARRWPCGERARPLSAVRDFAHATVRSSRSAQ